MSLKEMIKNIPPVVWARAQVEVELTEALAEMMEREGKSLEQLAEEMQVSRRWLNRVLQKPNLKALIRIMAHLGYRMRIQVIKEEK